MITPHRKLLILAVNNLVERGFLSLAPVADERDASGEIDTLLDGELSIVYWHHCGFDEVTIDVYWKCELKSQAAAKCRGWLERKTGPHLMGCGNRGITERYLRREARKQLDLLDAVAVGFKPEGRFFI